MGDGRDGHDDELGEDEDEAGTEDLVDLIGQGRFVELARRSGRRALDSGASHPARSWAARRLGGVRQLVGRWESVLRVLAAVLAATSAVLAVLTIFVFTVPVIDPDDPTGREIGQGTLWELGLRTTNGGSFGVILRVVAPAALGVMLIRGRWWRAALAAVTVYSVHWIGEIADYFEVDLTGVAEGYRRIHYGSAWSSVALAAALTLGCLLLASTSPGDPSDERASRWELAFAFGGAALLPFTWAAPVMDLANVWVNYTAPPYNDPGTVGPLWGFPLTDLAAVIDHPSQYASRYLPVVLVVVTVLAMVTRSRSCRPWLRLEVWIGLAVGVVADVVQRAPFWYDDSFDGVLDGTRAIWSPNPTSLALLVLAAASLLLAAWLAKTSLDRWRERVAGAEQLEPLEVWSLE